MNRIKELFSKPIDRNIEEVIKVDQHNESTVKNELDEYIVTDSIKDHFYTVYDEIIQVKQNPREGIGAWVSGFFGSGKSSFAKILGYTVSAKKVLGKRSGDIFKENVKDPKIAGLIDVINRTIPTHTVIFDISMDKGIRKTSERITEIMYIALLRELDYSTDLDLAELEITLEQDGLLDRFTQLFEEFHQGKKWKVRRKLSTAINETSAVLRQMDPRIYPEADSYARSVGSGRADITPNLLAQRAFELTARRMPGKILIFIIDEVGQYVSRSVDRMLDLQAIVQAFGKEGKNRAEQNKTLSPYWIIVTSQEKLNEVVDSLDSKKIELARLQDRFRVTIDLKQTDIPEIAGKRLLEKKHQAKEILDAMYEENEGRIKTLCGLERTSRDISINKESFVKLYPYLPYQINLCIDIVSGLRLKRGANRQIGGSNRTIIKQAQQMMINPTTMLAEQPLGTLVTLDKVYELVDVGNLLPVETSREIAQVKEILTDNPMAVKVAKTICLLETVKDLPRTIHNISVVLHPSVHSNSIKQEVATAVKILENAQIIRDSDEGYKLLTVQEKHWDTNRKAIDPKPADKNRIMRAMFREIFTEPKIKNYRFKNLRPFKMIISVEEEMIEPDGQFELDIMIAEDSKDLVQQCKTARENSSSNSDHLFWVCRFSEEIHLLFKEVYRSTEMISSNERLAAHGKLSPEENACLADEKIRRDKNQRLLRTKLIEAVQSGSGFFRGVQHDSSALGNSLHEILHKQMDIVIPDIFPKLEMGIRQLKGDEVEKFLTAVNLNGLPPVFYDSENGLSLVQKQVGKYIPHISADICQEILSYIQKEHKYGNKVTGKMLENYFQGIGYGWDREVIRLVSAVLLRGGALEVTHQGRRYRNHSDPNCRIPFTKIPAFRAASFAPVEPLDLHVLADAEKHYEDITGKEVDIEESAIAAAFKNLAARDKEMILPLEAQMKALQLPGFENMENFLQILEGILNMSSDDCVKTLAGEGNSYKQTRTRAKDLHRFTANENNLELVKKARIIVSRQWPDLQSYLPNEQLQDQAEQLQSLLEAETFYLSIESIKHLTQLLSGEFTNFYTQKHRERLEIYQNALEEVKGLEEWLVIKGNPLVSDIRLKAILEPLTTKQCINIDLHEVESTCRNCRAALAQLATEIQMVNPVKKRVIQDIKELSTAGENVRRIKVSDILTGKIENPGDVEIALDQLKNHLLKLISSGKIIILE